jgi:hypothetical protein
VVGSNRDRTDKDSEIEKGVDKKVICKGTNKRKLLPTGPLDDSAISYAKAFMATPKRKNPKDTSSSVENSEIDGSSESDAGQEAEASDKSSTNQTFLFCQIQKIQKPKDLIRICQPATAGNPQQIQNNLSKDIYVRAGRVVTMFQQNPRKIKTMLIKELMMLWNKYLLQSM